MEIPIQCMRFLFCIYFTWIITCEGRLGLTSSSQHLGCLMRTREGPLSRIDFSDYSVQKCVSACHALNRSLAGLEGGVFCYCGNTLTASDVDSVACYDDHARTCVDYWCGSFHEDAMSVYRVCPLGYWGPDCRNPCPSSCGNRGCRVNSPRCLDFCHGAKDLHSGCQEECPPGTFGPECTFSCADRCLHGSCDPRDGRCLTGCQEGLKGPYCTDTCQYATNGVDCGWCGCSDSSCDGNCTRGCYGGWTGDRCDECPADRWGASCDLECEPGCVCNVHDSCESCVNGFYGERCTHQCHKLCIACDRETGHCESCVSGYFGANCNERCPSQCFGRVCLQDTGHCEECDVGYFGLKCTDHCPSQCARGECSRDVGTCAECNPGLYGEMCTHQCPQLCFGQTCDRETGKCKSCVAGYYGVNCTERCPNQCLGGECSLDVGACAECNPGYAGDMCQSYSGAADCKAGQTCSDLLSSTRNNQDVTIGLGVVVGILTLAIIAGLLFVNRARLTALVSSSERPLPPLPTVTYDNNESGYENPEESVRVHTNQGRVTDIIRMYENQGDTAREYENHGASVRVSGVTENSTYDHIDPRDIDFSSPTYQQIQQNS